MHFSLAILLCILALAALLIAAKVLGAIRWSKQGELLRQQLAQGSNGDATDHVDFEQLGQLPDSVQVFFRAALQDRQKTIIAAHMVHHGQLNLGSGKERWKPFVSDQLVTTTKPGFDWNAIVTLCPGLVVNVRDAYINGSGILRAALQGLIEVGHTEGPGEIAQGELMRFLAEAAWYPTTLLPSSGVSWEQLGSRSARATLIDHGHRAILLFEFNADGLIETVTAEQRGRLVGKQLVPTPWRGRFWNYAERDGMRVPLQGEVAWIVDGVPKPYWRGHLDRIKYTLT